MLELSGNALKVNLDLYKLRIILVAYLFAGYKPSARAKRRSVLEP